MAAAEHELLQQHAEGDKEYLNFMKRLHQRWRDAPEVYIHYENLEYRVALPARETNVPTLPSAIVAGGRALLTRLKKTLTPHLHHPPPSHFLQAVAKCKGFIAPSSMTLVLAPPGHGKSSFLQALSSRLPHSLKANSNRLNVVTGSLLYNSLTEHEALAKQVHVRRLCTYISQNDLHFPTLTVDETLRFAAENANAPIDLLLNDTTHNKLNDDKLSSSAELKEMETRRAEMMITMLGLDECKNTVIGNNLLRGVSGGQRRRVTLAEMMLSNARVLMMDEPTTGLDAAVSHSLFLALKEMTSITRMSVVCALLQPSPELYHLFDNVILLREGEVVYHGPRSSVKQYFRDEIGVEIPSYQDEAAFVVDYLLDPKSTLKVMKEVDDRTVPQQEGKELRQAKIDLQNKSGAAQVIATTTNGQINKDFTVTLASLDSLATSAPASTASNVSVGEGASASSSSSSSSPSGEPAVVTFHLSPLHSNFNQTFDDPANTMSSQQLLNANLSTSTSFTASVSPSVDGAAIELTNMNGLPSSTFSPNSKRDQRAPAMTTKELKSAYMGSVYYHKLMTDYDTTLKLVKTAQTSAATSVAGAPVAVAAPHTLDASRWSAYSRAQFASSFPLSIEQHFRLNVKRQTKLIVRNRSMLPPRVIQSILMGIIYSTLFFQLAVDDFQSKFGLLLYCIMFGSFANMTELPVSAEAKNVVAKQLISGFYPTPTYIIACVLLNIPIIVFESLVFGTLMYWIAGLSSDPDRYFFFLLIIFLTSNTMATFFRSISYVASNPDVARQLDMPFIMLFVLFGGFMIPYSKIPTWLTWVYWMSPFSWAVRALAINEFGSSRYDTLNSSGQRYGWSYMDAFGMQYDYVYKWTAVAYALGVFLLFCVVSTTALSFATPVQPFGTKRLKEEIEDEKNINNNNNNQSMGMGMTQSTHHKASDESGHSDFIPSSSSDDGGSSDGSDAETDPDSPTDSSTATHTIKTGPLADRVKLAMKHKNKSSTPSSSATALPFEPCVLAWRDVNYSVMVQSDDGSKKMIKRQLLHDIHGYAKPGTMTALMGASGAGKTTLMDLIAGRKTVGEIKGDITVNGRPKDPKTYGLISGYVEQNDIHIGTATVREALEFSASLRLPVSVTAAQRSAFVSEVMQLIGLTRIAGRIIGDEALPGLSPGQLKLVTIGVELVANPSILFLDEPTSGLDAPAAYQVMRAVRRIANTGRTIVCTIHQPSQLLFQMFHRLLLLKSGGHVVYFGDLGHKSKHLVHFFHDIMDQYPFYANLINQPDSISNGTIKNEQGLIRIDIATKNNGGGGGVEDKSKLAAQQRLPLGQNPASWMLDIIGAAGGPVLLDYATVWRRHATNEKEMVELSKYAASSSSSTALTLPSSGAATAPLIYSSWLRRYFIVQYRYFQSHWRNPPMNLTRFILLIVLSVLFGLVYLNLDQSQFAGVQSLFAVLFLCCFTGGNTASAAAMPTLFRQRAVYYRETTVGMYDSNIYSISLLVVEIPYVFCAVLMFTTIIYWMVGLQADAIMYFRFVGVAFVGGLVMGGFQQLLIASLPNMIATNVVNGMFTSMFFMFGGLFKHANVIPTGWLWFYYIDPIPKAFIAIALPQVYCDTSLCEAASALTAACGCPAIYNPSTASYQYVYDYASQIFKASRNDVASEVGWLLLTWGGLRLLTLVALKKISHIKR